jgi:hypothetical protein
MYPKTGETTTTAVELEVNAKRRTAASIGKFGEEDLFRFTAASDGRYQIDTRGPTDIVMKLFGPNSETGQYFVQVRHYNRASGKGNYSIKVQRL